MASFPTLDGRARKGPHPEPMPAYYTSNILRLFSEDLERRPGARVLDVGPVCGENINFFAKKVKRLYVCDMFLRLDQDRRKGLLPERTWQHLDYLPQSFDGILMWDLADRIEDREAQRLTELCRGLMKPGGKAVVFVLAKETVLQTVNTFVIGDNFQVYLRPQPHLNLPLRSRQNRDVLAMMSPFKPVKSFLYRNGVREFLFQND